jgi:hypothetical protein
VVKLSGGVCSILRFPIVDLKQWGRIIIIIITTITKARSNTVKEIEKEERERDSKERRGHEATE